MVIDKKFEAIGVVYLNLKIPYNQAEALVSAWHLRYPQYDHQTLIQWFLAGDVSYADGKLTLADYATPEELSRLIRQMRSPGGVEIQDRRYKLRLYPRCFVGSELVQWLMSTLGITQDEAVHIGKRLLYRGIIHHVLDEQDFKDGYLFYRFYVDEQ
ncbi:MAG: DEP domain-containing protein [Cyanobacteria bacterium P01_F01_bin.116]